MDIEDAIRLIKHLIKRGAIIESRHYTDQLKERELDPEEVSSTLKGAKILGTIYQEDETYRLWFYYRNGKDLNIIIRILDGKKLRVVTVFPSEAERRIR